MDRRLMGCVRWITLLGCMSGLMAQSATQRYEQGRVLVKFRESSTVDAQRAVLNGHKAEVAGILSRIGVHVLRLPAGANAQAVANAMRGQQEVEFAELDLPRQLQDVVPNDPNYGSEWHLKKIAAPAAWGVSMGSSAVTVAVVDTGVDGTHADLAGKLVPGWNLYDNTANTADVYGHGTKVAGTIGALTNNGQGVASVAWNCLIMPMRISAPDGSSWDSIIADGITQAADRGARVANVSYQVTGSSTVSAAAKYFQSNGGVVTVSAGNYSTFNSIPADPALLTISATDANDALYSWSDSGTDLDLAAPGCVTTTAMGGGYASACGTSFSAPIVAGVAALVYSVNPLFTAADVTSILKQSADDLGTAGWDTVYGWGRVNAYRAVSLAMTTAPTTPAADTTAPAIKFLAPSASSTVNGVISVSVSASDNVGVTGVTVARGDGTVLGTCGSGSCTFSWDTAKSANGVTTLVATARDAAGNAASTTIQVTVSNVVDTVAPLAVLNSPAGGATLTGNVSVAASASDNVGVVKLEIWLDKAVLSSTTGKQLTASWNTRKAANGAHTLTVRAYDAAGNVGVSPAVSVTVKNK